MQSSNMIPLKSGQCRYRRHMIRYIKKQITHRNQWINECSVITIHIIRSTVSRFFIFFFLIIIQITKRGRANCCGAFDKRCACDKWPWPGSSGNTSSYAHIYIVVHEQLFFLTPFSSRTIFARIKRPWRRRRWQLKRWVFVVLLSLPPKFAFRTSNYIYNIILLLYIIILHIRYTFYDYLFSPNYTVIVCILTYTSRLGRRSATLMHHSQFLIFQ